ncbi:MAG: hypothetical protein ACLTDY_03600 [Dialister invisus]
MEVRMLCEKNGKRNSETERRIYASGDKLTASLTTVTDPSLRLWMTPFVLRHHDVFRFLSLVTCFPKIVIQNGGKNAVWERRETGQ